jgi:hypothetical protein
MFEIPGDVPEPIVDEIRRLGCAENDRPYLEVRNRGDGHPPFTEREREIHLNGTGGVKS